MTLVSVNRRLERLHQQSRIAAGSLIVSVFGDAVLPRGGAIWLGSLITLMEQLGVNERLVRTTVFRLVKDDWLHSHTHGRKSDYHLSAIGRRRFDEAARHIYAAQPPAWDHQWRCLLLVGDTDSRTRDALRRSLRWQGFGEVLPGYFLHPNAELTEALNALTSDGLDAVLPQLMPLTATRLPPLAGPSLAARGALPAHRVATDASMVRSAWDLAQLASGYQGFLSDYQPVLDELQALTSPELATLEPACALRARSLMIHDFRRLLLQDPELPAELLPPDWPGQQARTLCAAIYRQLLPASERFLDQQMQRADGQTAQATAMLEQRFQPPPATKNPPKRVAVA